MAKHSGQIFSDQNRFGLQINFYGINFCTFGEITLNKAKKQNWFKSVGTSYFSARPGSNVCS